MSNALTVQEKSNALITFDDEQIDLIKRQIAVGATNDELALFMYQCERTGLDPLARQIHFQKYNGKVSFITTIDGYRLIADRTGRYAGSDEAVFTDIVKAKRYKNTFVAPKKATVTVWKLVGGVRMPFTASAIWFEYFPQNDKQNFMWEKMPCTMLEKCAEAKALRKAFPADLSGVYTQDEMQQAIIEPVIINQPQVEINKSHQLESGTIADSDGVVIEEPETIEGEIVEDEPVAEPIKDEWLEWWNSLNSHQQEAGKGKWVNAIAGVTRYADNIHAFKATARKIVDAGTENYTVMKRDGLSKEAQREQFRLRVALYDAVEIYAYERDKGSNEYDALKAVHDSAQAIYEGLADILKAIATDDLPPSASAGTYEQAEHDYKQPRLVGGAEPVRKNAIVEG